MELIRELMEFIASKRRRFRFRTKNKKVIIQQRRVKKVILKKFSRFCRKLVSE